MALLMSRASGNRTANTTWATVDSELDSNTGNTAVGASYTYTSNFTPSATTIDGFAIKVASYNTVGSPTATFQLYNNTTGSVEEITVNVSDLKTGWNFIKLSTTHTANGTHTYKIGSKASATGKLNLVYSTSTTNWSRVLRTVNNPAGAPAAGDRLLVLGELTGAGTGNSFTVTEDNTADVTLGSASAETIVVGTRGTFSIAVAASTTYLTKLSGFFRVAEGGTFNTGTIANPMPSTSTWAMQFVSVATGTAALIVDGTWIARGYALSYWKTKLTADVSAGGASLTVADSVGWKSGDVIAVSSTTRTPGDAENVTLSGDSTGTTVPISVLAAAHNGTVQSYGDTRATVVNMTRNVKIYGTSATYPAYINITTNAVVDIQYLETKWVGSSTTLNCITLTTINAWNIQYCSFRDMTRAIMNGLYVTTASGTAGVYSNNVIFNVNGNGINLISPLANTFNNNAVIKTTTGMITSVGASNITNNFINAASTTGLSIGVALYTGNLNGNTICNSNGFGTYWTDTVAAQWVNSLTIWRVNTGLRLLGDCMAKFGSFQGFGCATSAALFSSATAAGIVLPITFTDSTFNNDSAFSQPIGISIQSSMPELILDGCKFGNLVTHSTADVSITASLYVNIINRNTTMASTTKIVNFPANTATGSMVRWQRSEGTAGSHKCTTSIGTIQTDSTVYRSKSPSLRLAPANASQKLESGIKGQRFRVAVKAGQSVTVSLYIRESVTGDGADYNGSRARLIAESNNAIGINGDQVLATATVASEGAWEKLTGTINTSGDDGIASFFVDCDGTTGWVNVDDFSTNRVVNTKDMSIWSDGIPLVTSNNVNAGGILV